MVERGMQRELRVGLLIYVGWVIGSYEHLFVLLLLSFQHASNLCFLRNSTKDSTTTSNVISCQLLYMVHILFSKRS